MKTAAVCAAALVFAFVLALPAPDALAASPARASALLGIRVTDAVSGEAIGHAAVCFLEAGVCVRTDADGYTRVVRVPYRASGADLAEGTATVAVLAEGYVPTICEVRTQPTILRAPVGLSVFPSEDDSPEVLSMIEAPSDESLARLLRRAKALAGAGGE